jgi:hypothetical protein
VHSVVGGEARKWVSDLEEKNKEMSELCAQFRQELANHAKEQAVMRGKITAFGIQQGEKAAGRGKFTQELGSLKVSFTEEQTK